MGMPVELMDLLGYATVLLILIIPLGLLVKANAEVVSGGLSTMSRALLIFGSITAGLVLIVVLNHFRWDAGRTVQEASCRDT
jgi:hypothetical protein